ncbi:DUF3747 domain-containing protein [Prochlorothrix hollandica]|uniref:S-layer protein n=1 Tax=Prochlorothrix hollandica PCC 9006 = CALU 1027 TaxID=317619 RepID=A0A0M2PUK9_PROHO|nr:DUF3747 domain-containing protein [Prochlorothrix hollandica]KKI98328.1 S-layer protein [Prochlorothrix hollandica PCC 9006 = CALU 1027]
MKSSVSLRLVTGLVAGLSLLAVAKTAVAQTFGQQEIAQQNRLVPVAAPVDGGKSHKLVIFEQISDTRACWGESGSNPTIIDPLLLGFDFTGICSRSVDSNGYSIRMAGEDLGLIYSLAVVHNNGDIVLVGKNPINRSAPVVEIGRAYGMSNGYAKLNLYPGWRFTRRTYEGKPLGHIYVTNDQSLAQVSGQPSPTQPVVTQPNPPVVTTPPGSQPPTPQPVAGFPDIAGDLYRSEIEGAIARGFVGGFPEDNTFRPLASLTREQLVSLVLESLGKIPGVQFPLRTQASGNPYPDVAMNRWSAAKIQMARDVNIVSGYPDGLFRPNQVVTRAEMMAVLRRAAEYGKALRNLNPVVTTRQAPFGFSDTASHWSGPVVSQMSGYCRVASPLNEQGVFFAPDTPAQRNYAAAATLRMLQCVETDLS